MSRRVLFRPDVLTDIAESTAWYRTRGWALGEEFAEVLDTCLETISEHPLRYPVLSENVHRAVLPRFPYSVIYEVTEEEIIVLACLHGRRNLRRWWTGRNFLRETPRERYGVAAEVSHSTSGIVEPAADA